nr:NAD(P)H-dependent oxidoreductase [Reichenbachiella versicolor]
MITIISGTNRNDAKSPQIAKVYQSLLSDKGVDSKIIDLKDLPIDFIGTALYENSGKNESFNELRNLMHDSKKFVFIVPEYNGSFPGVLKAFMDGMIFPTTFKNKKAALVGLSSGIQGGGLALSHLTDILNYCGTHVLAQKPKLYHIEKNFDGEKLSELYESLLVEQIDFFVNF